MELGFAKKASAMMLAVMLMGSATSLAEGELDLAAYRGKVIVLDFWASWCVPCRRSFPWLNAMHEKYASDGLVIIGVNVDNDRKAAQQFLEKFPARFKIHYDVDNALVQAYDLPGMPSSYVIDRDGELRAQHIGFKVRRQAEYEAVIVDALGEERAP